MIVGQLLLVQSHDRLWRCKLRGMLDCELVIFVLGQFSYDSVPSPLYEGDYCILFQKFFGNVGGTWPQQRTDQCPWFYDADWSSQAQLPMMLFYARHAPGVNLIGLSVLPETFIWTLSQNMHSEGKSRDCLESESWCFRGEWCLRDVDGWGSSPGNLSLCRLQVNSW